MNRGRTLGGSSTAAQRVRTEADAAHQSWSSNFQALAGEDPTAYQAIDEQIEVTKAAIVAALAALD